MYRTTITTAVTHLNGYVHEVHKSDMTIADNNKAQVLCIKSSLQTKPLKLMLRYLRLLLVSWDACPKLKYGISIKIKSQTLSILSMTSKNKFLKRPWFCVILLKLVNLFFKTFDVQQNRFQILSIYKTHGLHFHSVTSARELSHTVSTST